MPLLIDILKDDMKDATVQCKKEKTLAGSRDVWIDLMAKAIDKYIRGADVITAGTATTQTGKIT